MCTLLLATSVVAYHFTLSVVIFYVIFVISRLCYGHESINVNTNQIPLRDLLQYIE